VMPDGCLLHASLAIKSLQSLSGHQ
jgi:hypothetical protein